MERSFRRISDGLKLPQESRERIRSQIASYQVQQEGVPMKKSALKIRASLVVAVVAALTLTIAAAATVAHLSKNDIIVPSMDDIPFFSDEAGSGDAPLSVAIAGPSGNPPHSLEEMTEGDRFKSDDWSTGEWINGGVIPEYNEWDSVEVLSSDPSLRIRRVSRADGAEKMEYTAENPANLVGTLVGPVTFDLSWMGRHYDYVPDANMSFVVTDKRGRYVSELFSALYAKPDESGYVRIQIDNVAKADYFGQSYIIDGSYETAYYYATPGGHEFLIKMHNGTIWADCSTSYANVSLYGAYLTSNEIEDILDNLSLSISG